MSGADAEAEQTPGSATVPRGLLVAAGVVAVEAAVLMVLAVVQIISASSSRITLAVTVTIFLAGYGVGLAWCARGLAQARSWARGPVVLTQLIQLGLAWNFRGTNTLLVALLLVAASVVVLGAVFSRSGIAAMESVDD